MSLELEDEFVPKSGTKSELWQHFGLKKGDNGKPIDDGSVYCRLCRRKVKAGSGNTSNLKAHLKNNHRSVYSTLLQPTGAIILIARLWCNP